MASIYQRNGNYQISFHDSSRQPTQKQRSLGTSDERKAKRLKLDLEDAYADGLYDPWHESVRAFLSNPQGSEPKPRDVTAKQAMQRFLDAKRAAGRKENTVDDYERVIDLFNRFASVSEKAVKAIRPAAIQKFVMQKHLAAATKRNYFRHLRAWINWLEAQGYIGRNPIGGVEAPKKGKTLPKALRESELEKLQQAADPWLRRIINFAVYSGLRPSELSRLRWEDVSFERELIRIDQQKNGSESRIALTAAAREVLDEMDGERKGRVFACEGRKGTRWVEYVSKAFCALKRSCGLREELSLYSTRHTHATWAADNGVPLHHIKAQMRHSSVEVTQKYIHVSNRRLKQSMADVF